MHSRWVISILTPWLRLACSARTKFTPQQESLPRTLCSNSQLRIEHGFCKGRLVMPGVVQNWTMHYVGWQMQYMEAGLKYGAWKPYMYSNLATSLLGGMGSSEIGASLERFTEWATGDKMSNLLYDRWGDGAGSSFLCMVFREPSVFPFRAK